MPSKKTTTSKKPAANTGSNTNFQPTFRKYNDMSPSEQAAFRQGATTVGNKVKENLGLRKPRD